MFTADFYKIEESIKTGEKIKLKKKNKKNYLLLVMLCNCCFFLAFIFESIAVYYRSIDSNVCVFIKT